MGDRRTRAADHRAQPRLSSWRGSQTGRPKPVGAPSPDLTSLPAEVLAMIEPLQQQARVHAQELTRRVRELSLARVKIEKLSFDQAGLHRAQFDARTKVMTAEQRLLFADAATEN